jgi:hypothetical protein
MSRVLNFDESSVARFASGEAVIHVRFAGHSRDIALASLGIDRGSGDAQIKRAVAVHLEVPLDEFSECVIDRHANGNLTIRPEAVFG